MMTLTFNLKNNVRNEFLGSTVYKKSVIAHGFTTLGKKVTF